MTSSSKKQPTLSELLTKLFAAKSDRAEFVSIAKMIIEHEERQNKRVLTKFLRKILDLVEQKGGVIAFNNPEESGPVMFLVACGWQRPDLNRTVPRSCWTACRIAK
jgi:hypothetical protein